MSRGCAAVFREDFAMGKGRFVNQKLGKNVSRKFDLLKSALAGSTHPKSSSRPPHLSVAKKESARGKA